MAAAERVIAQMQQNFLRTTEVVIHSFQVDHMLRERIWRNIKMQKLNWKKIQKKKERKDFVIYMFFFLIQGKELFIQTLVRTKSRIANKATEKKKQPPLPNN